MSQNSEASTSSDNRQTANQPFQIGDSYFICTLIANKCHDPRYADLELIFYPKSEDHIITAQLDAQHIYCYVERTNSPAKTDDEVKQRELAHEFTFAKQQKKAEATQVHHLALKQYKQPVEKSFNGVQHAHSHLVRLESYGKAAGKNFVSLILLPFTVKISDDESPHYLIIGLRLIKEKVGGQGRKQAMLTLENIVFFKPKDSKYEFLDQLESLKKRKSGQKKEIDSKRKKKDTEHATNENPLFEEVNDQSMDTCQILSTLASQGPTPSQRTPQKKQEEKIVQSELDKILEEYDDIIKKEEVDANRVSNYFEKFMEPVKRKGSIIQMCLEHKKVMEDTLSKIAGTVTVTLFAKPGYGKSYIINQLVSNFKYQNVPLPSGNSMGKGMTSTVIDILYEENYSLSKEMCTIHEYNLRVKYLNTENIPSYSGDREILEIDSESKIRGVQMKRLSDDEKLSVFLHRAKEMILKFENEKTKQDSLTVKKLILKIPSSFLKESKIVLRDMPGYDEITEGELYKQYIRESLQDTSLILSGIENTRYIVDDGLVKKAWDYGIYQPSQTIRPSLAIVCNSAQLDEDTYLKLLNRETLESMKQAYNKQLSLHYNVLLDDIQISSNDSINSIPIDFENKYDFVKSLQDNFDVTFFPPEGVSTEAFVERLRVIIEKSRKKIIDYNINNIRDMAIVILSNIKVKKENKFPSNYIKKFNTFTEKMCEELRKKLELAIANSPDFESMSRRDISSLINTLVSFYETAIEQEFDKKELSTKMDEWAKSYKKLLKLQKSIEDWDKHYPIFTGNFFEKLESFTIYVKQMANSLKKSLMSTYASYELGPDFIFQLIQSLDTETENVESDIDEHIYDIYSKLITFHDQIRTCFAETEQSLLKISEGMDKNVKELLSKYKEKSSIDSQSHIELDSKSADPVIVTHSAGLSIPKSESALVTEIAEKHYCSHQDNLVTFKIEKRERAEIRISTLKDHNGESNEMVLQFDRKQKQLFLSFDEKYINTILTPIKRLTNQGLKPMFIMTRPRGKIYKPQLYTNEIKLLQSNNVPHMFVIVTESKYIARYKKWIVENGGNVTDYHFLLLDSNCALGPGIVHTSILALSCYLHIESIHIVHDDIRQFYEYLYDKKVFSTHGSAMIRALMMMEKVLGHELFNPQKKEKRKENIRKILLEEIPQDFKEEVLKIMQEKEGEEDLVKSFENGEIGILQVLRSCVEDLGKRERQHYTNLITSISNYESRDASLSNIAKNPQDFIQNLQELATKHDIKVATIILDLLEEEFNDKKHIGRVSLWDYQTKGDLKDRVHNLNKPTHLVSYQTSSVNTYFLPSMEGIYLIGSEDFWKEPNNDDRKHKLSEIKNAVANKKTSKHIINLKKQALKRGWGYIDIAEKTQMLLHGVGNFHVFCFGYASSGCVLSLVDYKNRTKNNKDFDSDEESLSTEEDDEEIQE